MSFGDGGFGAFAFGDADLSGALLVRTLPTFAVFPVASSSVVAPTNHTTTSFPVVASFAVFHTREAVPVV